MAGQVSSDFGDEEGAMLTDINVTPLVDVVLVLLIVFMITVPQIVGSTPIKVNLPETGLVAATTIEKLPLDIILKRDPSGQLTMYMGDRAITETYLKSLLASLQPVEDQPVSLSADKDIPYGEVVKVMDQLAGLGLHKLSLNTKHVGGR